MIEGGTAHRIRVVLQKEQTALAIEHRFGGRVVIAELLAAIRAEIALNTGHLDDAVSLAQQAVTAAQAVNSVLAEGTAGRVWGQALSAYPTRWDDAQQHLAAAVRALESGDNRLQVAFTHLIWGRLCLDHRERAAARAHLEQASAQFETSALSDPLAEARTLLARWK